VFIRVLVLKQEGQWLAQALDHNLSAQGSSEKQAVQSFFRILRARLRADRDHGREPLSGLPPAPDRFFDIWDRKMRELHAGLVTESALEPDGVPPAYVIKQIIQGDGGADLH
jgi:hypothetical protein